MPAPIIFFAYNRPENARSSLESLKACPLAAASELYIYCDGPKPGATEAVKERIAAVRRVVREQQWCGEVHVYERTENAGLAASVIEGVTGIVNRHGRCIVLEDDLEVSPFFLQYMNDALDEYAANEEVISIHGYTYPVPETLPETFFLRGADCWGWATWKRGWNLFEPDGKKLFRQLKETRQFRAFTFNYTYNYTKMLKKHLRGENDSWAIRWYASAFLQNKLTLYPGRSLVRNSGTDGQGTHVTENRSFDVALSPNPVKTGGIPIEEHKEAVRIFGRYFKTTQTTWLQRLLMRLNY